jgi:hypothetical protein
MCGMANELQVLGTSELIGSWDEVSKEVEDKVSAAESLGLGIRFSFLPSTATWTVDIVAAAPAPKKRGGRPPKATTAPAPAQDALLRTDMDADDY